MQRKLLIVEDEPDIAHLVQKHLQDAGYDADIASNGAAAMELFRKNSYQLVILDLMLPDTDGLTLCRKMRSTEEYVAILMLTAKSTELDRVLGLEMGADDYLTKPFSVPELMARIKALFRRIDALKEGGNNITEQESIERGGLYIDVNKRSVQVEGELVDLTAREFDLLLFFARHPGRVFSRIQLLDKVWGYNHDGYEHTVNSHINRLRSKIEKDPSEPQYVLTVWGVGYKFRDQRSES
ncbi:MAG: response regulator transcription factor [Candidatus Thiodiazotropha weberae]|uniref:Phosphate regulon transcriptional regulatory protein PhoB n=1 Tax=Candidatus Thiodiazotropha endoloripes TaxID=1818881 RepID=A0A1E2UHR4_9GAMM|nr:response regulator transcription factor [Candidatus Thiodiazotropha endoloripes]MCG7900297.1 response regulator transcription factor [Candidatus Thiodiazotropha weberae]MCG7903931.1 response regulator transcription factor [Candidatus Thiodiazotropha weberae]MCG7915432.1 response regulator transcription factor [Candidatus Thiodiazotropha weberae]ODB82483.1 DNA-binding response regulator [Candidatus Thiodiazotropha endoloripes]ODB91935.1 DNA-binding response regulator [Candidatus Thiodiazotro